MVKKLNTILWLCLCLLASLTTTSQKLKRLSVGSMVPDISFTMLNYPSGTAQLSDFQGKLVILDFWSTICKVCISKFPRLDSLQDQYKDNIQIILVNSYKTGDNESKIQTFLQKRKSITGLQMKLPVAINDSIAYKYFPHIALPHYVWIMPDGKVKAITSSQQLTPQSIQKILGNENITMSVKKRFFPRQANGTTGGY